LDLRHGGEGRERAIGEGSGPASEPSLVFSKAQFVKNGSLQKTGGRKTSHAEGALISGQLEKRGKERRGCTLKN